MPLKSGNLPEDEVDGGEPSTSVIKKTRRTPIGSLESSPISEDKCTVLELPRKEKNDADTPDAFQMSDGVCVVSESLSDDDDDDMNQFSLSPIPLTSPISVHLDDFGTPPGPTPVVHTSPSASTPPPPALPPYATPCVQSMQQPLSTAQGSTVPVMALPTSSSKKKKYRRSHTRGGGRASTANPPVVDATVVIATKHGVTTTTNVDDRTNINTCPGGFNDAVLDEETEGSRSPCLSRLPAYVRDTPSSAPRNAAPPVFVASSPTCRVKLFGMPSRFECADLPNGLEGRLSVEEFRATVNRVNTVLSDCPGLRFSPVLLALIFGPWTCLGSFVPLVFVVKRTKSEIDKLLAYENERLYNRLGLHWKLVRRTQRHSKCIDYALMISSIHKHDIWQPD